MWESKPPTSLYQRYTLVNPTKLVADNEVAESQDFDKGSPLLYQKAIQKNLTR
jgi:hypothetical protein